MTGLTSLGTSTGLQFYLSVHIPGWSAQAPQHGHLCKRMILFPTKRWHWHWPLVWHELWLWHKPLTLAPSLAFSLIYQCGFRVGAPNCPTTDTCMKKLYLFQKLCTGLGSGTKSGSGTSLRPWHRRSLIYRCDFQVGAPNCLITDNCIKKLFLFQSSELALVLAQNLALAQAFALGIAAVLFIGASPGTHRPTAVL